MVKRHVSGKRKREERYCAFPEVKAKCLTLRMTSVSPGPEILFDNTLRLRHEKV